MAEAKNKDTKRETKAGMLAVHADTTKGGESEKESEQETEKTPKISKEKAEERQDRPVH